MVQSKIGVIALLQDHEGRFLLAQRPSDKPVPHLWEFPGGKIEPGEGPTQALARELFEELGIHVLPEALEPLTFATIQYSDYHLFLLYYLCKQWEGEPYPKENQPHLEWVAAKDLPQYPMPEANQSVINSLTNRKDLKPL